MARAKKNAKKEISRVEINGTIIVRYDDGSMDIISTTHLSADEVEETFGSPESDDDDEDEDSDDEDEDDDYDESEDEDSDDDDEDSDEDEDDSDDEDEDEDDSDDEDDEDEDELTPEELANMDFEELEDLCDDKGLETDPDDFDEDADKLRKAIAKEMGITLPKSKKNSKKSKK